MSYRGMPKWAQNHSHNLANKIMSRKLNLDQESSIYK